MAQYLPVSVQDLNRAKKFSALHDGAEQIGQDFQSCPCLVQIDQPLS
jgi:hypothetical protein